MGGWNNFYLQKIGASETCKESVATWGVWCKNLPFKLFGKAKEPAKHSWYDEHGDDEYIPATGLYMDAYTMKVEFGCKKMAQNRYGTHSAVNDVRANVSSFLRYLMGGAFMLYSSYTRIGRRDVRLESIGDNAKWKSDGDDEFLTFEVTFKVNDPVTDVELRGGSLVVANSGSSEA